MSSYVVRDNFSCALDKRKYWTAVGMFWTFWSRGRSLARADFCPKIKNTSEVTLLTDYFVR